MENLAILALCFVIGGTVAEIPEVANEKVRNFLETYDRSASPPNGPTEVSVSIYVIDLRLKEQESVLELTKYMRLSWQDERLQGLFTDEEKNKRIQPEVSAHKYFWMPDLFFKDHRASDRRESFTEESLMSINSTGHVYYVGTYISTFNCPGLPREYYTDLPQITCPVRMQSYSHTTRSMVLKWKDTPVTLNPSIKLLDFTLPQITQTDCTQKRPYGEFQCMAAEFVFDRKPVHDYVGNALYVSSGIMVIAAWGGFWLDGVRHMSGRLALGLGTTIVLGLELGGAATWYEEWDLTGKKTQFWLAFCSLLVSATVMELVIVHVVLSRCMAKLKGSVSKVKLTSEGEEMEKTEGTVGRITDVLFGVILYPAIFIVFTIVFFIRDWENF